MQEAALAAGRAADAAAGITTADPAEVAEAEASATAASNAAISATELAAKTAAASAADSAAPLRIGIVGFGKFGKFVAKTFVKSAEVFAVDQDDQARAAEALGVKFYPRCGKVVSFLANESETPHLTPWRSATASQKQ